MIKLKHLLYEGILTSPVNDLIESLTNKIYSDIIKFFNKNKESIIKNESHLKYLELYHKEYNLNLNNILNKNSIEYKELSEVFKKRFSFILSIQAYDPKVVPDADRAEFSINDNTITVFLSNTSAKLVKYKYKDYLPDMEGEFSRFKGAILHEVTHYVKSVYGYDYRGKGNKKYLVTTRDKELNNFSKTGCWSYYLTSGDEIETHLQDQVQQIESIIARYPSTINDDLNTILKKLPETSIYKTMV
jgi:hypothetical protein